MRGDLAVIEIGVERPNRLARAEIFDSSLNLHLVGELRGDVVLIGDGDLEGP